MSSTEMWDPGTVAKNVNHCDVNCEGPLRFRVGGRWVDTQGYGRTAPARDIRPLLVLDPDDADQMRELSDLVKDVCGLRISSITLAEAVRAMLPKPTPVKPAEPTGLGAVVEDADGRLWLRVDWLNPWCLAAPNEREAFRDVIHGSHLAWDGVNAVRVLSEGVTP